MFLTPQETPLIASAMTALVALGGVYLTGRRDDRKARQERDRQDALDRERRWADKRLATHTAFAQATLDTLQWCESSGPADLPSSGAERPNIEATVSATVRRLTAAHDALARLELIAKRPVRTAAAEVVEAMRPASAEAAVVGTGKATEEQVNSWHESCGQARVARDAYLELAQGELGTA
jgi:hypothetical protein